MTIRKNFLFDEEVAKHLEELATQNKRTMTSLVEEMIEERYKSIKVKKRMKILKNIEKTANGVGKGLFLDKSIQSIKAEINV